MFRDISLEIRAGEKVCLLGANGSGKSTLLKMLCALIFPVQGRFEVYMQEITEDRMEDDQVVDPWFFRSPMN
ncbi:MAG: hypothetical protein CVU90_02895 [Firmicutes bacterium HGW-Firmicutes-15]|nr:MAG: hypothetical protein CVU90_02895 [Firmicutes bacterium HGW-Firmicutes-15]